MIAYILYIMWWEWHLTFLVFFPQTHNFSIIMRKTSCKSQLRDILQNTWLVFLKTAKITKHMESLRKCHNQEEPWKSRFQASRYLGAKHSRQKNRALVLSCMFAWHVQRAARKPKYLEVYEWKEEGGQSQGWPGHIGPCRALQRHVLSPSDMGSHCWVPSKSHSIWPTFLKAHSAVWRVDRVVVNAEANRPVRRWLP